MIDFHCHIDLYPDPIHLLQGVIRERMYVLVPTTTPKAWDGTNKLVSNTPRVRVALGLHPELVFERHQELDLFIEKLPDARYVGEIGVDGTKPYQRSLPLQQTVFEEILKACTNQGGKVLTIHSRGATNKVLDILQQNPAAGIPVLHWFSGSLRELKRAVSLGCWFTVGPAMLKGAKGRSLARAMPQNRIITETDGPFTSSGRDVMMPWDVDRAEHALADIWGVTYKESSEIILTNFMALAKLNPSA